MTHRYLTISADYTSSGLRDDHLGELREKDLPLGGELWKQLRQWVSRYEFIIPLEPDERKKAIEKIRALDIEGLSITAAVSKQLGISSKIRYFSEGLGTYISNSVDLEKNISSFKNG